MMVDITEFEFNLIIQHRRKVKALTDLILFVQNNS